MKIWIVEQLFGMDWQPIIYAACWPSRSSARIRQREVADMIKPQHTRVREYKRVLKKVY